MNLLLLLSALLSALTVGARMAGPEPVQAVAQGSARVAAVTKVAKLLALRPVSALPHLSAVTHATPVAAFTVATIPPWAARRRE